MIVNGLEIKPGANLRGANLRGANLRGAKLSPFSILPDGELTVWKKLRGGVLAKLRIPGTARRVCTPTSRKCRAERAIVVRIEREDGTEVPGEGRSIWSPEFVYLPGMDVSPALPFSDDIRADCASGIHFFITREEAVSWDG